MDVLNYDEETKSFLNKYLKPGKISYQKYIEKKILEPRINDDKLKATLKNDTKTIDYALGGGSNGQILAMPHFPDAHRIDNANKTLSHGNWTIKSSLNSVSKQGLSAILKDSARRVKTQIIKTVQRIESKSPVILYKVGYLTGDKIELYGKWILSRNDIRSLSSFKMDVVDSMIIPEGYLVIVSYYEGFSGNPSYYYGPQEVRNMRLYAESSYHKTYEIRCLNPYCGISIKEEKQDTPHNSAYGANGINPEITITMPKEYFISGFEFYGINELYNTSHNAKNIDVFGKYQNAKGVWITQKVLTFILPNNASWNHSAFYKLDIPGNYREIIFKVINNWGDRSSTKIGSISLFHHPNTTETKSIHFPTDIPVKINGINYNIIAGDYNMNADIKNKVYTFTDKQTGKTIATLVNSNSLVISYGVPKDMDSLLKNNKENVSFAKITNEIREKDGGDNLILLTPNKNFDTYETYKIKSYVYNNSSYKPNIKLYDSAKKEIGSTKYKVLMDDYPINKNVIIVLNIYIIVDLSITGAIYLKTTKNNNDLFEYNKRTVRDINTALNKSIDDSKNARNLNDLNDIFDITDKEDEIDDLELSLIKKSAVKIDAQGKTILSIRRDIEDYEDDITINKLKKTYYNMANLDNLGDNNAKVYHNKININDAIETSDKTDNQKKYNKYISYQNVPPDARTPSIEQVQSNEIYNIKEYAKKYIYFTVKAK
jgi:hypothetical protein